MDVIDKCPVTSTCRVGSYQPVLPQVKTRAAEKMDAGDFINTVCRNASRFVFDERQEHECSRYRHHRGKIT